MISATKTTLLKCFPPVVDSRTENLILGSFPGRASLQAQQYYAHPRNQFWALVSATINEDLTPMPYELRKQHLLAHGIGLWDVFAACRREGSLDSAIRDTEFNDFDALHRAAPRLKRLYFNGKTSGKFAGHFAQQGFEVHILPSSSPANAGTSFQAKLAIWRSIIVKPG